jgi:hypothetical protein
MAHEDVISLMQISSSGSLENKLPTKYDPMDTTINDAQNNKTVANLQWITAFPESESNVIVPKIADTGTHIRKDVVATCVQDNK